MRWTALVVCAGTRLVCALALVAGAALGGCRSDEELAPPDLSAPGLYCPPTPPDDASFVCDPTSIPYCSYPAESVTCRCVPGTDGLHVLVCGPESQPDDGLPTGTGT